MEVEETQGPDAGGVQGQEWGQDGSKVVVARLGEGAWG